MTLKYLILLVICILSYVRLEAQDLSKTANAFLSWLTKKLRSQVQFPFEYAERFKMNYVPIKRKGPAFPDFITAQKAAVRAVTH